MFKVYIYVYLVWYPYAISHIFYTGEGKICCVQAISHFFMLTWTRLLTLHTVTSAFLFCNSHMLVFCIAVVYWHFLYVCAVYFFCGNLCAFFSPARVTMAPLNLIFCLFQAGFGYAAGKNRAFSPLGNQLLKYDFSYTHIPILKNSFHCRIDFKGTPNKVRFSLEVVVSLFFPCELKKGPHQMSCRLDLQCHWISFCLLNYSYVLRECSNQWMRWIVLSQWIYFFAIFLKKTFFSKRLYDLKKKSYYPWWYSLCMAPVWDIFQYKPFIQLVYMLITVNYSLYFHHHLICN